jgi:hypothetical protein
MNTLRLKSSVAATVIAGAALIASSALASPLSVSGSVGGAPTGVTLENLDALVLGSGNQTTATGIAVSFSPDGQVVNGSLSTQYAAPYLSGGNGTGFGAPSDGPDTTNYITAGGTANSFAKLVLPGQEKYFGLLWGSVDDFNTLELYNGNTLVGTITGTAVTASPNGDQGVNGTLYVNIYSTESFDTVIARSSQHAFEFDNIAYNPSNPVPEPLTLSLFGAGLAGLGLMRRRSSRKA